MNFHQSFGKVEVVGYETHSWIYRSNPKPEIFAVKYRNLPVGVFSFGGGLHFPIIIIIIMRHL